MEARHPLRDGSRRSAAGSAGFSCRSIQNHQRADHLSRAGRPGGDALDSWDGRCVDDGPRDPGLPKRVSRRRGAVPPLPDRAALPGRDRPIGRKAGGRPAGELGDGPAGQACQRRVCATGRDHGARPAGLGDLARRNLRLYPRTRGDRLQHGRPATRRSPAIASGPRPAARTLTGSLSREGRHLRHRCERCRVPVCYHRIHALGEFSGVSPMRSAASRPGCFVAPRT